MDWRGDIPEPALIWPPSGRVSAHRRQNRTNKRPRRVVEAQFVLDVDMSDASYPNETARLLLQHASVRQFEERPIEEDVLNTVPDAPA